MCGIRGVVNCGDRETLARMTQVQAHRGPHDSGLWHRLLPDGSYVGLGSPRLPILALSPAGHVPMCNEDRRSRKDVLNARMKHRGWFRPFAPSIIADCQHEYFEHDHPSPFTLHVYKIPAGEAQRTGRGKPRRRYWPPAERISGRKPHVL